MNVILRFLLEYGHYIDAAMPEEQARSILRSWASGEYRLKGTCHVNGDGWTVPLDRVVAAHVLGTQPKPISALSGLPPHQPFLRSN